MPDEITGIAHSDTPQTEIAKFQAQLDLLEKGRDSVATTAPVDASVAGQLGRASPAFGEVLTAIGNSVAESQRALDQGVVDIVDTLNQTPINVVTQVVEMLNDDGLPDAGKTEIVTQEASLLNYFTPTLHEWKNVSVAMDLSVGSFHSEQGVCFNRQQVRKNEAPAIISWLFGDWFGGTSGLFGGLQTKETTTTTDRTSDQTWQSGQLRVDALLGPRQTSKLPVPASVSVGPQIYVTQGAVTDQKSGDVVTGRSVEMQVEIRKASGDPNPNKNIVFNGGGLLSSFPDGTVTDPAGKVRFTLSRKLNPGLTGPVNWQVSVSLGKLRKAFTVLL